MSTGTTTAGRQEASLRAGLAIQAAGGAPACAAGNLPDQIAGDPSTGSPAASPPSPPAALALTDMAGVTCSRHVGVFTMHASRRLGQRKLRHF
jgi:hypothetical protein